MNNYYYYYYVASNYITSFIIIIARILEYKRLRNEATPFCSLPEVHLYSSTVVGIVATLHCTENRGLRYMEVNDVHVQW